MKWMFIVISWAVLFACASAPAPESGSPVPSRGPDAAETPPARGVPDGSAERSRALEAMNKARSIKAEVAVKAAFDQAMETYNRAESSAGSGLAAGETYLESEKLFLAAYEAARLKREEAQKQLMLAREAVKQAEETAALFEEAPRED